MIHEEKKIILRKIFDLKHNHDWIQHYYYNKFLYFFGCFLMPGDWNFVESGVACLCNYYFFIFYKTKQFKHRLPRVMIPIYMIMFARGCSCSRKFCSLEYQYNSIVFGGPVSVYGSHSPMYILYDILDGIKIHTLIVFMSCLWVLFY